MSTSRHILFKCNESDQKTFSYLLQKHNIDVLCANNIKDIKELLKCGDISVVWVNADTVENIRELSGYSGYIFGIENSHVTKKTNSCFDTLLHVPVNAKQIRRILSEYEIV